LLKQRFYSIFISIKREITHIELHLLITRLVESTASARAKSTGYIRRSFTAAFRFVHPNGAAVKLRLVHFGNGLFSGGTV